MSALEALILVGSFGLALLDLWNNRHALRADAAANWKAYGFYFLQTGGAIALLALTLDGPKPSGQAAAATISLLLWIGLATLRLGRGLAMTDPAAAASPILRAPKWVDGVLFAAVLAGLTYYYGCSVFHVCS